MRSPDLLRTTVEPLEEARLLRAEGEIDLSTVGALRREIYATRDAGVTAVLDLSGVSFIDSTGLNLLLRASRDSATSEWGFFIVRPSDAVRRLIEVSRTADLLTLVEPAAERVID
jgi:stage II sporulation protein AA (anti-sigma F factor antagonist)